ncbi:gamma-glutamyl-gamma-aminobutyrate hydrolase family protein [Marinobacter sp.]|uniref:gamma-glutamyl-gamma-aminobutyrate hydrolase family protein n=1 Tax=Marinobacter sp. TaxID=50741 RepID=UPI003B523CCF
MRIGISQRVEVVASYGEHRDCLDQQWFRFLEALGFMPVPIPNSLSNLNEWLASTGIEGFILSGGNDLSHLPDAINTSAERDETERTLLAFARQRGWPVIGVCRGLQMMNVWLGGQLTPVSDHTAVRHAVTPALQTNSWFHSYQDVNSFHNWGIAPDGLAVDLLPQLLSPEGDIEAYVHRSLPWAGIMWHPEREAPFAERDKQLFNCIFRGTPCKH